MAVGIALLLDLAARAPRAASSVHSHAAFSAAAFSAAALSASGVPLSARHLFGFPEFPIAYCDAGATAGLNDAPDLVNDLNNKIHDSIQYPIKEYPLELKPLFSAFGYKNFGLTTLRSFLLYYLPLLEPRPHSDDNDDDDDLLQDAPVKKPVDLVTPFQNSVKQIIRETSVVTTRRVMERIAVRHISKRTAWKLLKDASKSSKRKAGRGMSIPEYTYCVARTTFRAHALGVAAAWAVQSIIEVYKCFIREPHNDEELFDDMEKFRLFGRRIHGITIKCGFSLVLLQLEQALVPSCIQYMDSGLVVPLEISQDQLLLWLFSRSFSYRYEVKTQVLGPCVQSAWFLLPLKNMKSRCLYTSSAALPSVRPVGDPRCSNLKLTVDE